MNIIRRPLAHEDEYTHPVLTSTQPLTNPERLAPYFWKRAEMGCRIFLSRREGVRNEQSSSN